MFVDRGSVTFPSCWSRRYREVINVCPAFQFGREPNHLFSHLTSATPGNQEISCSATCTRDVAPPIEFVYLASRHLGSYLLTLQTMLTSSTTCDQGRRWIHATKGFQYVAMGGQLVFRFVHDGFAEVQVCLQVRALND